MNLPDVRAGIEAVLKDAGIRTYDTIPDTVEPPCAVVGLGDGQVHDDFDDGYAVNWVVLVFVSRGDDSKAQRKLDAYLSSADSVGVGSIIAAVNADQTLNESVDSCRVIGWQEPQTYTIAGTSYVGVEINLEVIG